MKQKIYIFFHILKIINFMCKILLQNFMKDKNTWTKKKKKWRNRILEKSFLPSSYTKLSTHTCNKGTLYYNWKVEMINNVHKYQK